MKYKILFFVFWGILSYFNFIDLLKEDDFPILYAILTEFGIIFLVGMSCFTLRYFVKQWKMNPQNEKEEKENNTHLGESILLLIYLWGVIFYLVWGFIKY